MKVVHVVASDRGGAARAALRINEALQKIGVTSSVLVLHKNENVEDVKEVFTTSFTWNVFRAVRSGYTHLVCKSNHNGKTYYSNLSINLLKEPLIQEADVINLHWINDGMQNAKALGKLANSGKKIVWTMHDMYAFTAGCYYDNECGKYKNQCEQCPYNIQDKKALQQLQRQFEKKNNLYRHTNFGFIGCSNWMAECAKESTLLKGLKVTSVPNPIDTELYRPIDKDTARTEFSIESDKKIILFGAVSPDSDKRKGFDFLKKALSKLNPDKYMLIVFGGNKDDSVIDERFEVVKIGRISGDSKLAALYSLADVFVAPSIQENLSNAVMESLSCGTPVVAFNIGGMKDMIEHRRNGYLAQPFDVDDLTNGIETSIENREVFSNRAREKVIEEFSMDKVGMKYKAFYDSL